MSKKNKNKSPQSPKESIPGKELEPIEEDSTELSPVEAESVGEEIPGSESETSEVAHTTDVAVPFEESTSDATFGVKPVKDVPGKYRKFQ